MSLSLGAAVASVRLLMRAMAPTARRAHATDNGASTKVPRSPMGTKGSDRPTFRRGAQQRQTAVARPKIDTLSNRTDGAHADRGIGRTNMNRLTTDAVTGKIARFGDSKTRDPFGQMNVSKFENSTMRNTSLSNIIVNDSKDGEKGQNKGVSSAGRARHLQRSSTDIASDQEILHNLEKHASDESDDESDDDNSDGDSSGSDSDSDSDSDTGSDKDEQDEEQEDGQKNDDKDFDSYLDLDDLESLKSIPEELPADYTTLYPRYSSPSLAERFLETEFCVHPLLDFTFGNRSASFSLFPRHKLSSSNSNMLGVLFLKFPSNDGFL
eukprot:TRINITY_DN6565_c0_g1_i6.p1 TRINITY_DN6565_c0_g1~~TRINITY_DN6565_c0_g1_i6.p1  ORF type:complete len:324 (+),score=63.91 TRINITY_DN6565_c0_g1_i6:43-1014(+)